MAGDMRAATMLAISGLLAFGATGCGSSSHPGNPGSSATGPTTSASTSGAGGYQGGSSGASQGVGALSAEAQSAATGDIPDNQLFLTFTDPVGGYSMSYPEGWTRKGDGRNVTFSDKNNIVHVVVAAGPAPTVQSVQSELAALQQKSPTLKFTAPQQINLKSGLAIKATYTTESPPNPITDKSVLLIVDRYELAHAGKRATVDLGTAKGVDNVDAYRMMSNSFRWQ
jgi:hypothetical protein